MRFVMGAAVAAVMACACVGGAEAATLYNVDVYIFANISTNSIEPNGPRYDFVSYSPMYKLNGVESNFFSSYGTANISGSISQFGINLSILDIPTLNVTGDVTYNGPVILSFTGGSLDPVTALPAFYSAGFSGSAIFGAEDASGNLIGFQGSDTNLSGFISIATAPIPGSLPLFGAALLALGGLAYARRRASAITPQA